MLAQLISCIGIEKHAGISSHKYDLGTTVSEEFSSEGLLIILGGSLKIECAGYTQVAAHGQLVFLNRGCYLLTPQDQYSGIKIILSVDFLSDFLSKHASLITSYSSCSLCSGRPFLINKPSLLLQRAIDSFQEINSGSYSSDLTRLKIEEIFLLLLDMPENDQLVSMLRRSSSKNSDKLKYFMEENYLKEWRLDQFARSYGASLTAFKELFTTVYGVSPRAWIIERRLIYAHNLLLTSERSIIDVAQETGFSSQSYFAQAYRRRFGISPTAARKSKGKL